MRSLKERSNRSYRRYTKVQLAKGEWDSLYSEKDWRKRLVEPARRQEVTNEQPAWNTFLVVDMVAAAFVTVILLVLYFVVNK